MVNEARTYLINQPASRMPETEIGHEYIPADYRPATLPQPLQRVHDTIFGSSPDPAGFNLRFRQLAPFLHAPGVDSYTRVGDPRITYLPLAADIFETEFTLTITDISGELVVIPVTSGSPSTGLSGICNPRWRLTAIGTNELLVEPQFPRAPAGTQTTLVFTSGLSQIIPLPGIADLSIRVRGSSLAEGVIADVSHVIPPPLDIALVPHQVQALGGTSIAAVFGTDPQASPFYGWWRTEFLSQRMAGLMLGMVDAVRRIKQAGS